MGCTSSSAVHEYEWPVRKNTSMMCRKTVLKVHFLWRHFSFTVLLLKSHKGVSGMDEHKYDEHRKTESKDDDLRPLMSGGA